MINLFRQRTRDVTRRSLSAFPGVENTVNDLLLKTGLRDVPPSSYVVYGSFIRSLWTHEAWQDVNVLFRTREDQQQYGGGIHGQWRIHVSEAVADDPETVLHTADFTVCRVAFHDGTLLHGNAFFEHIAQRVLMLHDLDPDTAHATFLRTYKYARRGFVIPIGELARLLRHVNRDTLKHGGVDIARQSGGAILQTRHEPTRLDPTRTDVHD